MSRAQPSNPKKLMTDKNTTKPTGNQRGGEFATAPGSQQDGEHAMEVICNQVGALFLPGPTVNHVNFTCEGEVIHVDAKPPSEEVVDTANNMHYHGDKYAARYRRIRIPSWVPWRLWVKWRLRRERCKLTKRGPIKCFRVTACDSWDTKGRPSAIGVCGAFISANDQGEAQPPTQKL